MRPNVISRPIASLLLVSAFCTAAPAPVDMNKRAEELKALHWGMFICWSFSTFSGQEWTRGIKDISFFKATGCDTEQWVRTAKEAEMGYILFLTKHHDGFCLWDTDTTERKVTNTKLGIDVLAQLRRDCDKHGIKLALYFSEGEFKDHPTYHPGGYTPEMKKAQLTELLTRYGPIEYIWFDHAQTTGGVSHADTIALVKSLQPGCFVGFNHGDQTGADIRLGERGRPGPLGDHRSAGPHMRDKPSNSYLLAEFTYPILPRHQGGAQWFYSLPRHDGLCLPVEKLMADYTGAVRYGNIFSIDVGPDYAGRLRQIDVETLTKAGKMIRGEIPCPMLAMSQRESLARGKPARASSVWPDPGYEPEKAFDDDLNTRWGAGTNTRNGWLEIDLGKPVPVNSVLMHEYGERTTKFELRYKDGDEWKTALAGTTIGEWFMREFPVVEAQVFRLDILEATEVPTFYEVRLFGPAAP